MAILNDLMRALERSAMNAAFTHTRRYLLRQSDRMLADKGFSRELLERGNGAWPWRVDELPPIRPHVGAAPGRSRVAPDAPLELPARTLVREAVPEREAA